mgnify:CR=1 FL=1
MSKYDYDIVEKIHDYCIDLTNRTIYLHGSQKSDEDSGVDFKMSNAFLKNINVLESSPATISIHQQNIGGEYQSGMMIYDAIKQAKSHINIICHGEVMSMGTIILQAADLRLSMPNCHFMLHYGYVSSDDRNPLAAKSWLEMEDRQLGLMLDIYADKMKNSDEFKDRNKNYIKQWLRTKFKNKVDWHLSPPEALKYGLIDGIIGQGYELQKL